uniref:Uncharacterized protein n=1 Tax=Arundo donax TaxID=35708 RepID=A0A0A9FAU3_ARUDO
MALDSSAVQMLRSSSSMFMDPKSLFAPPSALWNSSNVRE